jgi:hypothetical protein
MSARARWIFWLAALIGVSVLVVLDRGEPPAGAVVEPASPRERARDSSEPAAESTRSAQDTMILAIRPRSAASDAGDAFAVRDWSPPPPPAAKPPPPPPPSAPPFPYAFFGKKLEDGVWQVFLRRDERILVVKSLDTIDNAYRIDEIRPPVMTLTYLPLQQKQMLAIGGAE